MSEKTKTIEVPEGAGVYEFTPVIEVCGECMGTGKESGMLGSRRCALCNGSGRIVKTKKVIIDIKPFE